MRWDRARWSASVMVSSVVALVMLTAACDTNDGRTLREPTEPAPTTSLAPDGTAELPDEPISPPLLQLAAPWPDGAEIDARYTCDGDDVSPALSWTGLPDGTAEVAIVVIDDDADGFVHWIVTGIDPATPSLLEGSVPEGARQLQNSFGDAGWGGPCPPDGPPHSYRFTVHALNQQLSLADDISTAEALTLINGATIGSATIHGIYAR